MTPGVWRYTTIRCVKVWKYYTVWGPAMATVAAIGCGGYVAGRALPAAPVPFVVPFYEPAPLLIPAPEVAYFPPGYAGYEPGVVGVDRPSLTYVAPSAPRHGSGPRVPSSVPYVGSEASAGGADYPPMPDENSVGPCCIQPHITDFFHSLPPSLDVAPLVPVPVPEPPGGLIFANAALWLIGLRARGLILAVAFSVTVWTGVFWAL